MAEARARGAGGRFVTLALRAKHAPREKVDSIDIFVLTRFACSRGPDPWWSRRWRSIASRMTHRRISHVFREAFAFVARSRALWPLRAPHPPHGRMHAK